MEADIEVRDSAVVIKTKKMIKKESKVKEKEAKWEQGQAEVISRQKLRVNRSCKAYKAGISA